MFFSLSENEEDVAGFSVTSCIIALSVGDLVVATFSVHLFSDISSRSKVPVEVAKSWLCSTGVDSIANPLFRLPSGTCHARFSSITGSGLIPTSNSAFCPSEDF